MPKMFQGINPALIEDRMSRQYWQIAKDNFQELSGLFGLILTTGPKGTPVISGVTSSHHALTHLTDFDDHPQYLYLGGRGGQTIVDNVSLSNTKTFTTVSGNASLALSGTGLVQTDTLTSSTLRLQGDAGVLLQCGPNPTSATLTDDNSTPAFDIRNGGAAAVSLRVRGAAGQTADLQRWTDSLGTSILAKVDSAGNLTSPTITASTGFSGSGASLTGIPETAITNGSLLARDADNESITGQWTFNNQVNFNSNLGNPQFIADYSGVSAFQWQDSVTGFSLTFQTVGPSAIPAAASINFPVEGGDVITSQGANQVLSNAKVLAVDAVLRANSQTAGVRFQDTSTSTKVLRFILSGSSSSTNNAIKPLSTASRIWTLPDYEGSAVIVGNQTANTGKLGVSNLTAQTSSIGTVTMLTSSANSSGMFRLTFYVITTTAGTPASDTVKITVAYNDGAVQTVDVPLVPEASAAPVLNRTHDLGTLNAASFGAVLIYSAASNAITYTTTVVKTGSPQYTIRGRIEALG